MQTFHSFRALLIQLHCNPSTPPAPAILRPPHNDVDDQDSYLPTYLCSCQPCNLFLTSHFFAQFQKRADDDDVTQRKRRRTLRKEQEQDRGAAAAAADEEAQPDDDYYNTNNNNNDP